MADLLSYAGIPLPTITAEATAYANMVLDLPSLNLFAVRKPKSQRQTRAVHTSTPDWLQARIGTLRWPTGASRWAIGMFLVDGTSLGLIRTALGGYAPANLVMYDGSDSGSSATITASMYMLPAWPVFKISGNETYYLLTLVDQRYFWWMKSVTLAVSSGSTTWAGLYGQTGISVAVDTVNAAYLKPGTGWNQTLELVAPLLDDIAYSVGQRIVCLLDGTVQAVNYSSAATVAANNLTLTGLARMGGEKLDVASGHSLDTPTILPASIKIYFPNLDDGTSQTKTAANPTGLANSTENKYFRSSGVSQVQETVWTPGAALAAYTTQFAADWYNWMTADQGHLFAGILPWVPSGLEDTAEWTLTESQSLTRVRRGPFQDPVEDLVHTALHELYTQDNFGNIAYATHSITFVGTGHTTATLTPGTFGNSTLTITSDSTGGSDTFTNLTVTNLLTVDSISVNTITVNNASYHQGPEYFTGGFVFPEGSVTIPGGTTNNLDPLTPGSILALDPGGTATITGMVSPTYDTPDGTLDYLINISDSYAILLSGNDTTSSPGNRWYLPQGCNNLTINPGQTVQVKWDNTINGWRLLVPPTCGGGSSLTVQEFDGVPVLTGVSSVTLNDITHNNLAASAGVTGEAIIIAIPSGNTTSIQVNVGGVFTGSDDFTYDDTAKTLTQQAVDNTLFANTHYTRGRNGGSALETGDIIYRALFAGVSEGNLGRMDVIWNNTAGSCEIRIVGKYSDIYGIRVNSDEVILAASTGKLARYGGTPVVRGSAIADVTGTAGVLYGGTEQAMLNDLKSQLNLLLQRQRDTNDIAT